MIEQQESFVIIKKFCFKNMFKSYLASLIPAIAIAGLNVPAVNYTYGDGSQDSYENLLAISGINNGSTEAQTYVRVWSDLGEDGQTPTWHGENALYLPKAMPAHIKWGWCILNQPAVAYQAMQPELLEETDENGDIT